MSSPDSTGHTAWPDRTLIRRCISQGQLVEASTWLRRWLDRSPDEAEPWFLLARVARLCGQLDAAIDLIRSALQRKPGEAEFLAELGQIVQLQGRQEEAVELFRQALERDPDQLDAHEQLGRYYAANVRLTEARPHLEVAVQLAPDSAELHNLLGHVQMELGLLEAAEASFFACLKIDPAHAQAWLRLGNIERARGNSEKAFDWYERALQTDPDQGEALSALSGLCLDLSDAGAIFRRCDSETARRPDRLSHILPALNYVSSLEPGIIAAAHFAWGDRVSMGQKKLVPRALNQSDCERRLRLGFVSADFCQHPVGRFAAILFCYLNREQFEFHVYDNGSPADGVTAKLKGLVSAWHNVEAESDEGVARAIREDEMDILFDLSGHTRGHRLGVFARRPAPVQISLFAYPNTTGLKEMDARITDIVADPPGATEHLHRERLVRLPRSAWVYLPPENAPAPPAAPPCERSGNVTFGCLNNPLKVSEASTCLWGRLLERLPRARLVLLSRRDSYAGRVRRELVSAGATPSQIEFLPFSALSEYLKAHQQIDLALDPFPYNGGVTTCDALWMGVPVLSLIGRSYVSRQGASVLSNAGLAECLAGSEEEFLNKAAELARPDRLAKLRQGLRERLKRSALMDYEGYGRELGAALRQLWTEAVRSSLSMGEAAPPSRSESQS